MRKILLIIIISLLSKLHFAQVKSNELGVFIGGSYYTGDLNPTDHFLLTQPALGLVFRHNFHPRLALRINALFGNIRGDDSRSTDEAQIQRNLSFKSKIYEFSGQMEFNFLDYRIGNENYPFSPYAFLGLAVFNFDPQAQLNNDWISLQPLGTEGQDSPFMDKRKYRRLQVSVPFGAGVKINISKKMSLGIEWGMRKTFTDYLDDVSTVYINPFYLSNNAARLADRSATGDNTGKQRGNSRTKDWYNFTGLVLTFKLPAKKENCPFTY